MCLSCMVLKVYGNYEEVTDAGISFVFDWLRDANCLSNSNIYPLSSWGKCEVRLGWYMG